MKHYLNVCDVNGAEVEPVDVITFGSPCQDLSVAGKRAGLKHESNGDDETTRSGLFMEAVRIIKEMRKEDEFRQLRSGRTNQHIRPRFAVWENVPGAFSSNKGEDFRVVLEELARIKEAEISIPMPEKGKWKQSGEIVGDGWSIAWRTLDAQYHGVPQRRRRIFLVADFADECAGEILFECQGLPGYPSQSREKGQGTSGDSSESIGRTSERECIVPYTLQIRSECEGGGKGSLIQTDKSACLTAAQTQTLFQPIVEPIGFDFYNMNLTESKGKCIAFEPGVAKRDGAENRFVENCTPTIRANMGDNQTAVAYGICSYESNSMKSNNPHSGIYEADTARTLDLNGGNPSCNQGGIAVIEGNGSRPSHHGDGYKESDIMYTLNATETHAVAFAKTAASLSAADGPKGPSSQQFANPEENFVVETDGPIYAIDRESVNYGFNFARNLGIEENGVNSTLTARGPGAVAHKAFSSSKASFFTSAEEELANTLVATDYKDPPIVNEPDYIVRRLTPTECARLQGMPDLWCRLSQIEDMSDEDYEFWKQAHKTYAEINGKNYKEKTKQQMITWYNKLQVDSAEYKAYGNGMALPCVRVPIHGIAKHGAKTMASLFDGIGGFPLAGLIDGIETLWTSEIELFPIAVTMERFREYEKYGCFTFGCDGRFE